MADVVKAVEKLEKEMEGNSKNPYYKVCGSYLIDFIKSNPEEAEKILDKDKTLKGSFNAIKEVARKRAVDGCGYVDPQEGFNLAMNYFGIKGAVLTPRAPQAMTENESNISKAEESKTNKFDVDLDDLLG